MLPKFESPYAVCMTALQQLCDRLSQTDPDFNAIGSDFQQLQQVYQQEIFNASSGVSDPAVASRRQLVQTEIHRTLRLLSTDLLFLQSSRQGTTTKQRLKGVRDRLEQLSGLTQAMMIRIRY